MDFVHERSRLEGREVGVALVHRRSRLEKKENPPTSLSDSLEVGRHSYTGIRGWKGGRWVWQLVHGCSRLEALQRVTKTHWRWDSIHTWAFKAGREGEPSI